MVYLAIGKFVECELPSDWTGAFVIMTTSIEMDWQTGSDQVYCTDDG